LKPSFTIAIDATAEDSGNLFVTLTLDKLTLKDSGIISVHATNSEGDVKRTAKLTVKGKQNSLQVVVAYW